MLEKVISGCQTGADIAGLRAAKACGLRTGGWMTAGFKTLSGPRPEYVDEFGIQENSSPAYASRTYKNAGESDGTMRFAVDWDSYGEICTQNAIDFHRKPQFDVDMRGDIMNDEAAYHDSLRAASTWLRDNDIKVLNVAGNAEQTYKGMEEFVEKYLMELFGLLSSS